MAVVQLGLMPFVGILLQTRGWSPGWIGAALTAGGLAGLAVTAPAGTLVDRTPYKRGWLAAAAILSTLAAAPVFWFSQTWVVFTSELFTALTGSLIGPALIGITLGVVGQDGLEKQNAGNQVAASLGILLSAALGGWFGARYGFPFIFLVVAVFLLVGLVSAFFLPADSIDHDAARGSETPDQETKSWKETLRDNRPFAVLLICLALFNLGDGGMLPLFGQAMVAVNHAEPIQVTAWTIIVSRAAVMATTLLCLKPAMHHGPWRVLLLSFLVLPIRAAIAATLQPGWSLVAVQILDGAGDGLQGLATAVMVARLLQGSGRVNWAQGAALTCQGLGGSLSPLLAGLLADCFGYRVAFLGLGSLALIAIALWTTNRKAFQASASPSQSD